MTTGALAAERSLAKEKVDLEATKRALDVARQELEKINRKTSQCKKSGSARDIKIPGVEETIAPRNCRVGKKIYPIRAIEDVCRAYGLALVPNLDLPDIPAGRPYWRPERGEVFTSICPICGEALWVNSYYQRWTCLRCDRRFLDRKHHAPDAVRLVEHLTGCSHHNAFVVGSRDGPAASTERATARKAEDTTRQEASRWNSQRR